MRKAVFLFFILSTFFSLEAQVTLSTNFTNNAYKKATLTNVWSVANRISPETGAGVRADLSVNLIRMIGGINKTVNGKSVPYTAYDPCRYDTLTSTYVYNWTPLKARINAVRKDGIKIHQLVVDQPPWAFQHGYTFIPKGTRDNIHFREDERQSVYGNSLPPADKVAYSNFIKAMITELIATYGRTEIESWRFRVGSEIETPDHWFGTKQDFIDHFANTEKAIRAVLPNAIVGLHTREPSFVYRSGTVLNYKGEVINSFAKSLIEYCYANNVRYDFWGISDYVMINTERNIPNKYTELFAPLTTHAKWNANATCDIMEYSVVIGMSAPDGGSYLNCVTSHTELVNIAYSQLFYKNQEKGLQGIFRWGNRPSNTNPPSIEAVNTMVGKIRYQTNISGTKAISTNQVDAIFAKSETEDKFDALVYNSNPSSLNYQTEETVNISITTDLPVDSKLKYRNSTYGKEQNTLQNFLLNEPTTGWVKSGWDKKGDPSRTLNTEGAATWALFKNPTTYGYNDWSTLTTIARTDGGAGSVITLTTKLASFSFKKFEFIKDTLTGISSVLSGSNFVYPNPSSDGKFKLNESIKWSVYSIKGNLLFCGNSDVIDLSGYVKGNYILKTDNVAIKLSYY